MQVELMIFILEFDLFSGNFLENNFWISAGPHTPPPTYKFNNYHMGKVGHVAAAPATQAAALGPLACPRHSARPRNCTNLTR